MGQQEPDNTKTEPTTAQGPPKRRMGIAGQILIGLVAGIVCGIFFGEVCAPLQILGNAFVGLLQMTVLPFIVLSLIAGIGKLTASQSRLLLGKVALIMLALFRLRRGESRGVVVLGLLILGLSALQAYAGLIPFSDKVAFDVDNIGAVILNTLQYITFQKVTIFKPLPGSLSGGYIKLLTQILVPIQVGLFGMAVRNRFRR